MQDMRDLHDMGAISDAFMGELEDKHSKIESDEDAQEFMKEMQDFKNAKIAEYEKSMDERKQSAFEQLISDAKNELDVSK